MPSPIAHIAAGYMVYRLSRNYEPQPKIQPTGPAPGLLQVVVGFSLLPDVDSIVGVLSGNFGRYHNNVTHSIFLGALIALGFGLFMKRRRGTFGFWFLMSWVGYSLHVFMDAATWGRGVMALWPSTRQRFLAPLTLFHGLHWSQGWRSKRHMWTFVTEVIFALAVVVFMRSWSSRMRKGS